jgi:hypothetical protein
MSVSVSIRGTAYTLMQDRDEDYGVYGTNLLNAIISAINASLFIETGTRLTRVDYTGATSTNTQTILFGSEGNGTDGDDSIGIRNVNGALEYKEAGGNWTDIGTALSANVDLSNLSATTAVNDDIKPGADDTLFLGIDAKEWQAIWTRMIKHGSATDPDLSITTESNDGNIILDPHGTGEVQLGAKTIIDTTVEVSSGLIEETASDLDIEASGAGMDVNITADTDIVLTSTTGDIILSSTDDIVLNPATDTVKIDISGTQADMSWNYLIQDYTAVGSVGSANQQFAGRDYTLAELEAYFTAEKVKAFYKYAVGALGIDEKGTYNRTLGAAAKAPSSSVGIMGLANTAVSFDGGDYMDDENVNCLLDDMTTTYSGAGKGLIHSFWVSAPADGQPAALGRLFNKTNSAANDAYRIRLETSGQIAFSTNSNGDAVAYTITSTSAFPNGVNTNWFHIVAVWNTTNGKQLYINGKLEGQDASATSKVLMADGTTTNLFVGATDTTPTNPFTGLIANEVVVNDVCTQAMVDFLYATTIPLPTALQGKDFQLSGYYQNLGVAADVKQYEPEIVTVRTTDILMQGGLGKYNWQATDKRRLLGRV